MTNSDILILDGGDIMDWIIGIQNAINYIEDHITEELDYTQIAKESFASSFHFQRVFSILCGYTLGEYIRNRRLTLAGKELASTEVKVIDVAYKFGYDNPESFARAFHKFHGITPSQARNDGAKLKSFSRMYLKLLLEGGTTMNYRVEKKLEMTLLGYRHHFVGAPYGKTRYEQEENFFITTRAHQWMLKGMANDKQSDYCVLTNMDDEGYDFYFGVTTDNYERSNLYNKAVTGIDFMERFGFEVLTIPACTYAVFETEEQRMPIPDYFEIRKQIAGEWLASTEFQWINAPEIAVYHWGIVGGYEKRMIEIWTPIAVGI